MRTNAHWLEELNPADSLDMLRDLAHSHACESGHAAPLLKSMISQGDFRGLVEYEINYLDPAWTPHAVKHCRQALAFFQKLESLKIGINKREVALKKFLEAESACELTNEILKRSRNGEFKFPNSVDSILHAARRKIARILGPVPRLDKLALRFGPGATRGVKKKDASIRSKLAERLQCSEDLVPMVHMVLSEMPHLLELHSIKNTTVTYESACEGYDVVEEWCTVEIEVVDSKVTFQEKNAKTYRAACTEPGLNVIVQLGLGDFMATRLAAFGIDIRDQSLNQRRAANAVINNDATVDLRSASDMISYELIFDLLPWDWACLLRRARSTWTILPDGSRLKQAKFSSMGNGFTFPLETLIFWALAASTCNHDGEASAYGDDLIVPCYAYPALCEVLHCCGFVVNTEKSFDSGPFRESCGKDFFSGFDVRPFYQKKWVSARSLFVLHNYYKRDGDDERSKEVLNFIHPDLQIFGPDGYGDGHLIGEHPKRKSQKYHDNGYSGYLFSTFTQKSLKSITASKGDYVVPIYSVYRRGAEDLVNRSQFDRVVIPSSVAVKRHESGRCYNSREAVRAPSISLPNVYDKDCGEWIKELSLPGGDGYKRISIYTLG